MIVEADVSKKQKIAFISYAHEDYASAMNLYNDLREKGINCWLDKESLRPGELWKSAIKKAIRESDWFLALLSEKSVSKRGYVQKELKMALEVLDEVPEDEIFLIPIRLEECEPRLERIYERNWVDFFPSWENGINRLSNELVGSRGILSTKNNVPVVDEYFQRLFKIAENQNDKLTIDDSGLELALVNRLITDLLKYAVRVEPDFIVGVNRGGIIVAAYVALSCGIPSKNFSRAICQPHSDNIELFTGDVHGNVLVIDDISRSGTTLHAINKKLKGHENVDQIFTAVLIASDVIINDENSGIDYYSAVSTNADIVMPWSSPNSISRKGLKSSFESVSKKSIAELAMEIHQS